MSEHVLRPAHVTAAAVLIGGVLIALLPRYAVSIAGVVIVTAAAAAGLHAVVVSAPPTWWLSPFDRRRASAHGTASGELDGIRSLISRRRQRIARGVALPPGIIQALRPIIESALERAGVGSDAVRSSAAAITPMSPLTAAITPMSPLIAAVLATEPLEHARWFSTIRPDARQTADLVQRILDDLENLDGRRVRRRTPDVLRSLDSCELE